MDETGEEAWASTRTWSRSWRVGSVMVVPVGGGHLRSRDRDGHDPPGRGKFLLKLGKGPGKPFQMHLASQEWEVNDTNRRWAELAHRRPEPIRPEPSR